jgi:hypothetical protein
MRAAADALMERPVVATVVDTKLVDDALRGTKGCLNCHAWGSSEMREFGKQFAAEVDRVTSQEKNISLFRCTSLAK